MLIVLYDVSLLVNKVCNLTRSVWTLFVFLHGVTLVFRFRVCVSVFSDIVAIDCELRLSTRGFLATVYAVVSTRTQWQYECSDIDGQNNILTIKC